MSTVSSDDHQVSLAGGGYPRGGERVCPWWMGEYPEGEGMSMSRGWREYPRGEGVGMSRG